MQILPLNLADRSSPAALEKFLGECRQRAIAARHDQLVSISIEVPALDPLAVLESIFEPGERHFYVERPAEGVALAGAEEVVAFTARGAGRFQAAQAFIDRTLANTVAVGCAEHPFGGPHFFAAFTFEPEGAGEAFAPASIFVPRWQVATRSGRTVAVANLLISAQTPVELAALKVWRAHQKFSSFDYAAPAFAEAAPSAVAAADAGAEERYRRAVTGALAEIARGDYQKIVLARTRQLGTERAFHPLRVLNGLRQRFPDCYAFSIANGRGASFIGASPERLLEVRSGKLRTEALAGSARRGAGASEDAAFASGLLRDEKESREHQLVVEFIAAQLKSIGLSPRHSATPSLRRFANVQHLHTSIEAPLADGSRILDVADRLFPTPAVGGTPREAVLSRIAALEGFERGLYAGALGWIDHRGDGELLVGLRSALIEGRSARLYAGAGIVAGSTPEKELAETDLKFQAMQEALLS